MKCSVSVVIPSFNSAEFLPETIDSVKGQSITIDEIIVVDDGSTDNTESVISALQADIIYTRQQNQGPSSARNRGIEIAKCDYIAFLDADDKWPPDFIRQQLDLLAKHPDAGLAFGDMRICSEDIILLPSLFEKNTFDEKFFGKYPIVYNAFEKLLEVNFIPTGTVVVPRKVLLSVGGFPVEVRSAEDRHLWLRIAGKFPVLWNPNICLYRERHDNNITLDEELSVRSWVQVIEDLRNHHNDLFESHAINPSSTLSHAEFSLGYYLFTHNASRDALRHFYKSFRLEPGRKNLLYCLASLLGSRTINQLRKLKQALP